MTIRAILFSALALCACAQTPPPAPPAPEPTPAPLPQPRTEHGRLVYDDMVRLNAELTAPGVAAAQIGQTANLGDGLSVRPIAIIEDSRCPRGTRCLWPGRMRILALVAGVETELTLDEAHETAHGAVVFAVASPSAWADWPSGELGPRPANRFGFRRD
jgi:hypothetical protein